jgi:hypothetical protein
MDGWKIISIFLGEINSYYRVFLTKFRDQISKVPNPWPADNGRWWAVGLTFSSIWECHTESITQGLLLGHYYFWFHYSFNQLTFKVGFKTSLFFGRRSVFCVYVGFFVCALRTRQKLLLFALWFVVSAEGRRREEYILACSESESALLKWEGNVLICKNAAKSWKKIV